MKSKKILIIIVTMALASGLIACRSTGIKDNAKVVNNNVASCGNILLAISKDEKSSYVMIPIKEAKDL